MRNPEESLFCRLSKWLAKNGLLEKYGALATRNTYAYSYPITPLKCSIRITFQSNTLELTFQLIFRRLQSCNYESANGQLPHVFLPEYAHKSTFLLWSPQNEHYLSPKSYSNMVVSSPPIFPEPFFRFPFLPAPSHHLCLFPRCLLILPPFTPVFLLSYLLLDREEECCKLFPNKAKDWRL